MLKSRSAREACWVLSILAAIIGLWVSYHLTMKYVKNIHAQRSAAARINTPDTPHPKPEAAASDKEEAEQGDLLLDKLCGAAPEVADCDEAMNSEHATLTFGKFAIPTPEFGAIFFLCILFWQFCIGDVTRSRWWAHLLYLFGTIIGVVSSAYFEYRMWTDLDKPCLLCMITHASTLVLFILAILLWPNKPKQNGEDTGAALTYHWPTARALVAVCLLFFVGGLALHSQALLVFKNLLLDRPAPVGNTHERYDQMQETLADLRGDYDNLKEQFNAYKTAHGDAKYAAIEKKVAELEEEKATLDKTVDYYKKHIETMQLQYSHWYINLAAFGVTPQVWIDTSDRPFLGSADAEHTVVIFSDFECSACRKYENWFKQTIFAKAGPAGEMKVVFLHWPICSDCNPTSKERNLHPQACKAAYAAEAAYIVGGNDAFWKMHDLLFEHQSEWKTADPLPFVDYAKQIGLDVDEFTKVMNGEKVRKIVESHVKEGMNLGKLEGIDEKKREYLKVKATPSVFFDNRRLYNFGQTRLWNALLKSKSAPLTEKPEPTTKAAEPDEN